MTYADVQTQVRSLLANRLTRLEGYSEQNVTEGDYRIFTKGLTQGIVLRKGAANSQRLAITAGDSYPTRNEYVVNIEVYVMYRTDVKTTRSNLNTEVEAVLAHLRQYPTLNLAGVKFSGPGDTSEPEEGNFPGSGWQFWRQIITYPVTQLESVAVAS